MGFPLSMIISAMVPSQETYIDAVLSYTIDVSLEGKLSFGLKAGGNLLNLDFNKLRNFDVEPVITIISRTSFHRMFGLGIYYHTNSFYAGLSAPNLLETDYFDNGQQDARSVQFLSKERINFYLITGYGIDLNGNLKFKPAFLTKVVGGAPLQVDLIREFSVQ